ncbi:hypothetical protein DdX_14946 [Ditylenchus destructor]|uniref:Uncharacterized protein n=1 Tax=Ditylenchus destructor TaxID=166010 RepID=A0AAD4MQC5_9BILA|nr:hypothetical protein DdX_14946 [Ditylenchus destructor]
MAHYRDLRLSIHSNNVQSHSRVSRLYQNFSTDAPGKSHPAHPKTSVPAKCAHNLETIPSLSVHRLAAQLRSQPPLYSRAESRRKKRLDCAPELTYTQRIGLRQKASYLLVGYRKDGLDSKVEMTYLSNALFDDESHLLQIWDSENEECEFRYCTSVVEILDLRVKSRY